MDLKLKGKSWAGNIYHQFESICQDVDEFMSKDTVRFVENQVQSVGISVKRFYSNVVNDVIPLSGDIVKPESQSVDSEQVDMWDHVNSVTDIRTNPTCVNEKQMSVNQGSIDTSRNSDASLAIEVDHVIQFTKPPYADPSPEAKTYLHLREDGDAIICNDADNGVEENITRDSIPVTTNSRFDNEIFSGTYDEEDHKNSTKGKKGFSDETECLSNISSSGWLFESKLPMVEDPNFDENRSLSEPPVASTHKVNEDNNLAMDSPLPSACDGAHRALGKNGTLCDRFSTKDESFDMSSSVQSPERVYSCFSCDEEEEEMGIMPSTCSTSPKSSNILESTSANFIKEAENICYSHVESNGCAYNISTPSSTTAAYETKAVDMLPAFLILESNDNNAFPTDGSDRVVGSSESRHEHHFNDGQSKIAISPSETGNTHEFGVGIGDLNLETVDLFPDVKHDGRSVVLNGNFVHAASHRRRNFRYYKVGLCNYENEKLNLIYSPMHGTTSDHMVILLLFPKLNLNSHYHQAQLIDFCFISFIEINTGCLYFSKEIIQGI
ncbi:hypothetical protein Pfo_014049 [Paulownia fortunei]|nr:hypothetical protein Pfo_014049 [Paulownia fortunei]